jgi:hypothetical protein
MVLFFIGLKTVDMDGPENPEQAGGFVMHSITHVK